MEKVLTLFQIIEACAKHGTAYAEIQGCAIAELKAIQEQMVADKKAAAEQADLEQIIATTPKDEPTPIVRRR